MSRRSGSTSGGGTLLFQGEQGETIPMLHVAAADYPHQKDHGAGHENETDEQGEDQRVHDGFLSRRRYVVSAITTTELAGMRMAAVSGRTRPR